MFRYSAIAAALILVGSMATASAAKPGLHQSSQFAARSVTQIDQYGNYVISRTPGAIPAEPGAASNHVWR